MNNLTLLQIKYHVIDITRDSNRIKDLKELKDILSKKTYKHDNKYSYKTEFKKGNEEYKIVSTTTNINLYYNNFINTNYTKWKYTQLENRINNDIYILEYTNLQNEFKEFYYTKVTGKWINNDQYKMLLQLSNELNLRPMWGNRVKQDKITNEFYMHIEEENKMCLKENGKLYYHMFERQALTYIETIKNKIDIKKMQELLKQFKQESFITPYYMQGVDNTTKKENRLLITNRISDNIEDVKEYFYNNIYPNLKFKDSVTYTVV